MRPVVATLQNAKGYCISEATYTWRGGGGAATLQNAKGPCALHLRGDIHMARPRQVTPLYAACHQECLGVARLLVEAEGCDTDKGKDNGCTPLYITCQQSHLDVVRLMLVEAGVDM